jgi:quercetin dioxygenase-like cupin family protein
MITRRDILAASGGIAALTVQAEPAAAQDARERKTETMKIIRANAQPSRRGSAENFTGSVRVDQPFRATAPGRAGGAFVTFDPGARTAWHTHPLGQTLIVTAGCGWVQIDGGAKEEIRPGDIVWFPPGVKHWHGATATLGMTHLAIGEAIDGKTVDWMEKVSDAQYGT